MAILLVSGEGAPRPLPLPAAAVVGRAAGVYARLNDPAVPLHWLELRWTEGAWRWRTLSGTRRTRGVGMLLDDGWRSLPVGTAARPQRIRLDDRVYVELVEGGAPQPFLLDLVSGTVCAGEALSEFVEVRSDALLPLDAEGDRTRRHHDGDVFVHDGRAWRVHLADAPDPTLGTRIDLARPGVTLEVDAAGLRAVLRQGAAQAVLTGEHVRVLAVYADARRGSTTSGGWLNATDAWTAWRALGGNPDSPVDRIGWDRGRCRSHLARLGVAGVETLFESRRVQGEPQIRLAMPGDGTR